MRNSDLSWHDAKKMLRKDDRWELVESLNREERETLFNQHCEAINKKKSEKLR